MNKHGLNTKNLLLSSTISLTLADRRLYNYLLHNAFDSLAKKLNYTIKLTDLEGVYGTGLPPIERLKESLRRLMRTLVEFETTSNQWIITSLLEKASLNEREEQLCYSYPSTCQHLFVNPFTLEKCLIQAHFTQKYSNLLYEILSEAHFNKKTSLILEIADLRSRLQIADTKFKNFSDFERFVLSPALEEINSYASFAVKFTAQRKGMKVTHIQFEMKSKKNISNLEDAKQIIPPKRPRFFIDNPALESAYAYLLNAATKERRKYFNLACKLAAKKKINIDEETFDRPDLWFKWVEKELLTLSS